MLVDKIELNGRKLAARELTVNEVDRVLQDLRREEMREFEILFHEEPVPELAMILSLDLDPDRDNLLDLTHSQLVALIGEVKEANPFLLSRVEPLAEAGRRLLAESDREQPATEQIPSSGSAATSAA